MQQVNTLVIVPRKDSSASLKWLEQIPALGLFPALQELRIIVREGLRAPQSCDSFSAETTLASEYAGYAFSKIHITRAKFSIAGMAVHRNSLDFSTKSSSINLTSSRILNYLFFKHFSSHYARLSVLVVLHPPLLNVLCFRERRLQWLGDDTKPEVWIEYSYLYCTSCQPW